MSEKNNSNEIIKEIFAEFAKSQAKTEVKLETLIDSVNALTQSHIETKKDREYDLATMSRLEKNQKEQGEQIKHLSETMVLVVERQTNAKGKWEKVSDTGHKILLWVILAVIAISFGLKQ